MPMIEKNSYYTTLVERTECVLHPDPEGWEDCGEATALVWAVEGLFESRVHSILVK